MQQYSINPVGITTKKTKRGITLQAFNYTQNKYVGVGSVSGATYEKGNAAILKVVRGEYSPSFALTVAELEAARNLDATFLRCITPEPKTTYSISLNDFERYGKKHTNAYYGEQIACSVEYFAKTGNNKKRNSILDNPRMGEGTEYVRPQIQQLEFFRPNYDQAGNFRGGG